jgi:long-subunit acyl-CoA synthetase (AMP-forming)/predicted GNAT family acetyltransferase
MQNKLIALLNDLDNNQIDRYPLLCNGMLECVEKAVAENKLTSIERSTLFEYLDKSRKPSFLKSLGNRSIRNNWADNVFALLQHTGYSLKDMMDQRVAEHPEKILFHDRSGANVINWSYVQAYHHIKEIAAILHNSAAGEPRVALFLQNSVDAASCDLACLMFDIFDTPLSVHFDKEVLRHIFKVLKINIAVCDTKERLHTLLELNAEFGNTFKLFTTTREFSDHTSVFHLNTECKRISNIEVEDILASRKQKPINEVATTMFTSGSTGVPKGVSFSIYNIVSKRFARAAAVPDVGENEVFLCYLPLFHTFGRYLELTGSIFWGATYTMVGNSSKESVLSLFPVVNPSIFISIPLRWLELYEKCIEQTETIVDEDLKYQEVRKIIGTRLKWGLSAAGYLSPKVFKYFQSMGVALCSGFGMTEATGGITMTPPDRYVEQSTGIALPGMKTRLGLNGELEISGHYLAKYLEDAGPGDSISYPESNETDYWLSTGDVFTVDENGFHEIIDRVKDIYKNNKGQTVAPRTVEQKFENVPGILRTFLVGDARPYNVLLIVADDKDSMLESLDIDNRDEYFHQIVMAANKDLAPYERVINFCLLERDFSLEKGELTPKNSYNRKVIEQNNEALIKQLYQSDTIMLQTDDAEIIIPRWFFRDLGILENDIVPVKNGLKNKRNGNELQILEKENKIFLIGNLRYFINSNHIDLGLLARQPRIWLGNPELIRFCPVKEGWDLPLEAGYDRIFMDNDQKISSGVINSISIKGSRDVQINVINRLICETLYSEPEIAIEKLRKLGEMFSTYDKRIADVVRRRIEALAYHIDERVRVTAYMVLLLEDPNPDFSKSFPSFIHSGLPFLNESSIITIAESNLGRKHLDALRRRMYAYRKQFEWPVENPVRMQFENLLKLIFNFACHNLHYYSAIRSELANWVLLRKDPYLSEVARGYIYELEHRYDSQLASENTLYSKNDWKEKITFDSVITKKEQGELLNIFCNGFFIHKSIKLIYNEKQFSFEDITDNGTWVVKMLAYKEYMHYRVSINTHAGKHFDIHLVKSEKVEKQTTPETVFWHAAIAGHPYGEFVLPQLGCSNDQLGILTTQYIGGLTLWDKIREYSEIHKSIAFVNKPTAWRKKFIKAFTAIIKAWKSSGYRIIPGSVAPHNSVVPEMDFRDQAVILSLSGFRLYEDTLSLLEPMLTNFYGKTAALYPWTKKFLHPEWIFDSFIEALGEDEALELFLHMKNDLSHLKLETCDGTDFLELLNRYMDERKVNYYYPISLYNAVEHYEDWETLNPLAKSNAKEQTVFELIDLFQLQKHPGIVRYYLYRHSYFAKSGIDIQNSFDKLLKKMEEDADIPPVHLIELSDLQSDLVSDDDKAVFSRMVFPNIREEQKLDILRIAHNKKEGVVINSELKDKNNTAYHFRTPLSAGEVGELYNLFFKENYPKEISSTDMHFVLIDSNGQVIGGICYTILEENVVLLDGMVVISSLQGRGLGSEMIEDFFTRMASIGVKVVKAHFLFANYYLKHNFKVDEQWGALVRQI